ncbi:MAG: cell division protein FtsQ/DivIB [Pseudomonadota bacterium]|nr:cell division protein FtsQ/DivIB [Pseudomonadota bacterium]
MNAVLRFVAWLLAIALVALPVAAVVNGWVAGDRWPLRKLRVTSQFERVDPQQLRATVLPYAKDGFFAVRLEDAQAAVAKLPWVERAEVRKRWPDILEIRIVEHTPFARWGTDRLLSEHGRLFPLKSVRGAPLPQNLPQLDGEPARVAEVVALYNESRALLSPGGINVRGLAQDERGSWLLTLASGTEVVIGRSDAKARLSRFSRLLPRLLAQQQRPLARADLRYTNGFALSWQSAAIELPPLRTQERVGEGLRGSPRSDSTPSQPPPAVAGGGAKTQART